MNARRDRDRLTDITEAAAKISSRVEHGRSVFDLDEDRQIVLTHLIQIIGEAASRLSTQLIEQHPEVPWRALIGMRHRVVLEYARVSGLRNSRSAGLERYGLLTIFWAGIDLGPPPRSHPEEATQP